MTGFTVDLALILIGEDLGIANHFSGSVTWTWTGLYNVWYKTLICRSQSLVARNINILLYSDNLEI